MRRVLRAALMMAKIAEFPLRVTRSVLTAMVEANEPVMKEFGILFISGEDAVTAPAQLFYKPDDPYVVTVRLGALLFDVGREFMVNGGGEGQIEVEIEPEYLTIILVGQHSIVFRRPEIDTFLLKTLVSVPLGDESRHVDWDSELTNLGLGE